MGEVRKIVRFYEAVKVDQRDSRIEISDTFWTLFASKIGAKAPHERESKFRGVSYVGEAKSPTNPSLPYIQVSRVRTPSEQLDRYNLVSGDIEPLEFDNPQDRVAEPTFIVPFGRRNYVAVMSPAVRATRPEAIDAWLTDMMGLNLTEDRIELRPIIDHDVLTKILGARGASKLSVRIEKNADIPAGGGVTGTAIRDAARHTTDETSLEMTWSFGHATGSMTHREELLAAAQWVARGGWTDTASVNIAVEDEFGELRVEQHNIFSDRVTKNVKFVVDDGARPSEATVLHAIAEAIREFNRVPSNVAGVA